MSTLATTDPKELRSALHERMDQLNEEDLLAVRNLLLEIEIRRVREQLGCEFDELRAAGELAPEKIEASIREHRARHPYR